MKQPRTLHEAVELCRGVPGAARSYSIQCPAHDDRNPSLSVSAGTNGRVVLTCHTGCDTDEVLLAAGLEWSDLFDPKDRTRPSADLSWDPWKDGHEAARYTYTDEHEEPLFEVVRFELADADHPAYPAKTFRQRSYLPDHPGADDRGYVWGSSKHGIKPVLYRLPRLRRAIEYGADVYIVEGEKDVETLEKAGLTATCNPGGADQSLTGSRKWTPSMTAALKGARVILLPDNDVVGRAFMDALGQELLDVATTVRQITLPGLPSGGDVTDWLADGHSLAELKSLLDKAPPIRRTPKDVDSLLTLVRETGDPSDVLLHVRLLAEASAAEYAQIQPLLKEATGINLNNLEAAVQEARRDLKAEQQEAEQAQRRAALEQDGLPLIQIGGRPTREVVDEMEQALADFNQPPSHFSRGGAIVRLVPDERGVSRIEELSDAQFDDLVSRAANSVDARTMKPLDIPTRVVQRIQARAQFPPLAAVTEVPLLRPDGSVLDTVGYDEETGIYYQPPADLHVPAIPSAPTHEDVRKARALIHEAIRDFPFADKASYANTIALALTPIVQPLLGRANVPLVIIDATKAGTGKSLLAKIVGIMSTGSEPASMSEPGSEEEWRKQLTALFVRGANYILVDDIAGRLSSQTLGRALTSPVWSDRVLGATRQVELPVRATWVATGNNLRPAGDLIRRTVLVRMDAAMVTPWRRDPSSFSHKQPDWTLAHRGKLAAALLVLARTWIVVGHPASSVTPLGSFERWTETIGGILEHTGIPDFLGNVKLLYQGLHVEDDTWAALLEAIHRHLCPTVPDGAQGVPEVIFTAGRLARELERAYEHRHLPEVREGTVWAIIDALPDDLGRRLSHREPIANALGTTLDFRKDRRFRGGWYVTHGGQSRDGVQWAIRRDPFAPPRDANDPDVMS